MNKIINGKKYNTETADKVCRGCFGNFGCKTVTLYRKKSGDFFEHHELDGREWIVPVDETEAKRFAEEQLTADEYEAIFGDVEE